MKNKLLILTLFLPLWIGCFYDIPGDHIEKDTGTTHMSLRSSQITFPVKDNVPEAITLNSLRILVFSNNTGKIVTNQKFDISNYPAPTAENNWTVDFSDIVVATRPGPSTVYVVLNEDISSISGQTLTGALNKLSTLIEMQNLVNNTPLSYTTPIKVTLNEPPFIMSTFGVFDIEEGRTKDDPYHADLTGVGQGFQLDRTMAKVTIDSITSYPIHLSNGDTTITDNKETSYIFILKVGLTNVPKHYLWSPNRPQSATVPPIYDYEEWGYQDIDFGLQDPVLKYYKRDWNGNIKLDFIADTYEAQRAKKSEIWYTGIASGIDSYSLNKYKLDSLYIVGASQQNITSTDTVDVNAGNFPTFVKSVYNSTNPKDFYPSTYNITDANITPNLTGAYWTLEEKNISYYVPEHILETPTNPNKATKLHVKAAKASVSMPDSIIGSEFDLIRQNWTVTSETDADGWIYSTTVDGQDIFALKGNTFTTYMRGLYGQIPDVIRNSDGTPYLVNGNSVNIIRHYWKGIMRYREGDITGVIEDADFQDIVNSKDTMNFYLPIRNTPADPVDYNIYRNHEYKFSVHALEQWEPETRSSVVGTTNTENLPVGSMVLRNSAN